jgi:hypothetical protein
MISTQSSSESCTDNTGASENTAKELGRSAAEPQPKRMTLHGGFRHDVFGQTS